MTNQTESTAEVGELLPCPFCGGDASDIEDTHSDIIGERYIGCFGRKCELQPHYDYNENRPRAKDRALAAWNTRTPPIHPTAESVDEDVEDGKLDGMMLSHLDGIYLFSARKNCDALVRAIIMELLESRARLNTQMDASAFIEALTPSGATKSAYGGEFKFTKNHIGADGNEYYTEYTVPWTTLKEIMSTIMNRARLNQAGEVK